MAVEQPAAAVKKAAKAADRAALKPFAIISSSYLLFTITDGAVRMVVLLHANAKGFTALEVAAMFSLYELAGVATNLAAGIAGDRYGLRATLLAGLVLQLAGFAMLLGWSDDFERTTAIAYVTLAQMLCGIAKDLTKLGGKTVTKLVTPAEKQTRLFRLVSMLTGLKNSLKGVGYFLGAALLGASDEHGYELTIGVLGLLILLAMPWPVLALDRQLGRGDGSRKKATLRGALTLRNHNLNMLSLARVFLFASRDFWFEVPLPFFLRAPACAGLGVQPCSATAASSSTSTSSTATALAAAACGPGAVCGALSGVCENPSPGSGCGGLGVDRLAVGTFLALYIILYGQVQSWTPQLAIGPLRQQPPNALVGALWAAVNVLPTAALAGLAWSAPYFVEHGGWHGAANATAAANAAAGGRADVLATLIGGVVCFAFIFGVNSSVHSYLVVRYAATDKVAKSVGFYYMSNAAGRFLGTVGSGLLYTYAGEHVGGLAGSDATRGLAACFVAGSVSSVLAALIPLRIHDDEAGLRCGACCVCVDPAGGAAGDGAEAAGGGAATEAAASAAPPISAQPGKLELALALGTNHGTAGGGGTHSTA
jgi:MFS family permease